jgi:hypothetical protein
MLRKLLYLTSIICVILIGCTGVEPSPEPGIVQLYLQADPSDTTLIILPDTIHVSKGDRFEITIFQTRVFSSDGNYAYLYKSLTSYTQEDIRINIFERDSLGKPFKTFKIYESRVPPGKYNRIQMGVIPNLLDIWVYEIPVQVPAGVSTFVNLEKEFEVKENKITGIYVKIYPLQSLRRSKDIFQFEPKLDISAIKYE